MVEKGEGRFRFWDFDKHYHVRSNEVLQMSATDISVGMECEWKLYHKYSQALKPPKNVYLLMGSCFHYVVEQDLRYFIKRGNHYKWYDLEIIFKDVWEREKVGCKFTGKLTEEQGKVKCKNYIRLYSLQMLPLLYPLNNECIEKFFRVFISFGGVRLGITGKVDMIGRDMWVTDHKTSSKGWTQKEADEALQAQIYPFCIKQIGHDVLGFKFNVVSGAKVEVFPVEYNQSKVKKFLTSAFEIKRRIEEGNMLRSKYEKVCRWCDFNSICAESLFKKEEIF